MKSIHDTKRIPNIDIVDDTYIGMCREIVLRNADERHDGCVRLYMTPKYVHVDRWFYERWHQCYSLFHISKYETWKRLSQNPKCGDVLTRYSDEFYERYNQYGNSGDWYVVDHDMIHAFDVIVEEYIAFLKAAAATRIQTCFRRFRAKKKFSKEHMLLLNELYVLPAGCIHPQFPGGQGYRDAHSRWVGAPTVHINCGHV